MPEKYIGNTHVLVSEYACKHCGQLPPRFLDDVFEMNLEYQVLFRGYEEIRRQRGDKPLGVTNGYRCLKHEQDLYDAWLLAGRPGEVHGFLSVHVFGLALDLVCDSWSDQALIVSIARKMTPRPRIGWKQYKSAGSLLVHIDYGQMIQPCPTINLSAGVEW
jgi:hypothetical protein